MGEFTAVCFNSVVDFYRRIGCPIMFLKWRMNYSSRLCLRLFCLLLCFLLLCERQCYASVSSVDSQTSSDGWQAADVLQIRPELERLLDLRRAERGNQSTNAEIQALRALILRKTLLGSLDVRRACSKVDIELAYTYAVLQREQHKQADVNQLLNVLNFAQFSTLYTIEPYLRINLKFKQSAVLTCVGAGIGTGLPILGILYNKYNRPKNTEPPNFLSNILDGGPVDTSGLPSSIERFFNSPYHGGQFSRREVLFSLWKKRYGVDASKKSSLCSLSGDGMKSFGVLNTRIVLLWSLHTFIEEFDQQLFALYSLMRNSDLPQSSANVDVPLVNPLNPAAKEAARLLKITNAAGNLIYLNSEGSDNIRRTDLEITLLETIVAGMLEMRVATNKIDGELNYAYDVVLSQLLARRGKGLQRNFEANFIQTGIFSSIAGLLFLKGYPKAGNEMFLVQGGVGTALTVLALWQMRGGKKKRDTSANSLAQFFEVGESSQYKFSPLVEEFMSAPAPDSRSGKSRREFLLHSWKERRIATVNLDSKATRASLAALSPTERDTIKIVRNRIDLLHSLKARLEEFNGSLYELLAATEPVKSGCDIVNTEVSANVLNPAAKGIVDILQLQPHLAFLNNNHLRSTTKNVLEQKLFITRRVLSASLDETRAAAQLDLQIATETSARDRVARARDLAISMTNNANFFQINVLGLISDGPLGLSADPKLNLYGNRLNIVSGYMVGGLTAAAVVERHGGLRSTQAQPNLLSSAFGLKNSSNFQLSPSLLKFLQAVAPTSSDGRTRMEELVEYWKVSKILSCDVQRQSTREKLSANGPSHHYWSENIKLMTNRIRMLYDLKAVVSLMNYGLSELLQAVDADAA